MYVGCRICQFNSNRSSGDQQLVVEGELVVLKGRPGTPITPPLLRGTKALHHI